MPEFRKVVSYLNPLTLERKLERFFVPVTVGTVSASGGVYLMTQGDYSSAIYPLFMGVGSIAGGILTTARCRRESEEIKSLISESERHS